MISLASTALAFPLERIGAKLLAPDPGIDFRNPPGEAAMVGPDSVSWQVFRNPVTMFIGGVAAVLLELGEPRVRTGVWEHSSFRRDPAGRRTGRCAARPPCRQPAFLFQALHQPAAATCLLAKSGQAPALSLAEPWKSWQLPQFWLAAWLGYFFPSTFVVSAL